MVSVALHASRLQVTNASFQVQFRFNPVNNSSPVRLAPIHCAPSDWYHWTVQIGASNGSFNRCTNDRSMVIVFGHNYEPFATLIGHIADQPNEFYSILFITRCSIQAGQKPVKLSPLSVILHDSLILRSSRLFAADARWIYSKWKTALPYFSSQWVSSDAVPSQFGSSAFFSRWIPKYINGI